MEAIKWAEGLILQLPKRHEGRGSWLMNHSESEEGKELRRNYINRFPKAVFTIDGLKPENDKMLEHDSVNRPSHYTDGKIEVIDFIEDKKLNFNTGNAVKYISRAGKKDPAKHKEDLMKAKWYLEREISKL